MVMYDGYDQDRNAAIEKWRVTAYDYLPNVTYVEASAGTGSRYAVVVTELPSIAGHQEGGSVLVTVLSPWQDAWAVSRVGLLSTDYVYQRFCGDRKVVHGGDLEALTMTIRHALSQWHVAPSGASREG